MPCLPRVIMQLAPPAFQSSLEAIVRTVILN